MSPQRQQVERLLKQSRALLDALDAEDEESLERLRRARDGAFETLRGLGPLGDPACVVPLQALEDLILRTQARISEQLSALGAQMTQAQRGRRGLAGYRQALMAGQRFGGQHGVG